MAIMIPPVIHPGCSSTAEREIFQRLKDDADTRDWIVLHSLDLAEHVENIAGEIDFVVIIPYKGILCIEVKGCNKLRRQEGSNRQPMLCTASENTLPNTSQGFQG